jgi:hypothetical protein
VNPAKLVTDGHDLAARRLDQIDIAEAIVFANELLSLVALQPTPTCVVEKADAAAMVIVSASPNFHQAISDDRRNSALLHPNLSVLGIHGGIQSVVESTNSPADDALLAGSAPLPLLPEVLKGERA